MNSKKKSFDYSIVLILLLISCVLILVGALTGQPQSVFNKGIRICLECIGIG